MAKRKRLRDCSLRVKLSITYLVSLFVPLLIITLFSISRMTQLAQEKSFSASEMQCFQISSNISARLKQYYDSIYTFSSSSIVCDYFDTQYTDLPSFFRIYPDVTSHINTFLVSNPTVSSLVIYTDNPTFLSNKNTICPLPDDLLARYRERALELSPYGASTPTTVVSALEESGSRYLFSLIRPVTLRQHPVYNTLLVLQYPESEIYALYQHESRGITVYLCSPLGEVFSSSDRESMGLSAADVPEIAQVRAQTQQPGVLYESGGTFFYRSALSGSTALDGWELFFLVSDEEYAAGMHALRQQTFLMIGGITLLGLGLILLLSSSMTRRLKRLADTVSSIRSNDFNVPIECGTQDEIGTLARAFQQMLQRIERLIADVCSSNLRVKDLEIRNKQAELNALQSQINPHFLFNTMQSISISSYNGNDPETANYINKFCRFLRDSLYWEKGEITLAEELAIVENYLTLQKLRYQERFSFLIDVPEKYRRLPIPKFTIQPIVENALEHGIAGREDETPGVVTVRASDACGVVTIEVCDNGIGFAPEDLERIQHLLKHNGGDGGDTSVGLLNTSERLRLFCGDAYRLSIESRPHCGTRVRISLPMKGAAPHV